MVVDWGEVPARLIHLGYVIFAGANAMSIQGDLLTAGWGVIRLKPWHLAGIFKSSEDAERLARSLGVPYIVRYGDHVVGSPDFSFTSPNA